VCHLAGTAAEVEDAGVFGKFTQYQIIQNRQDEREKRISPVLIVHPCERVVRGIDIHISTIIA
jgi:hypothetical protein